MKVYDKESLRFSSLEVVKFLPRCIGSMNVWWSRLPSLRFDPLSRDWQPQRCVTAQKSRSPPKAGARLIIHAKLSASRSSEKNSKPLDNQNIYLEPKRWTWTLRIDILFYANLVKMFSSVARRERKRHQSGGIELSPCWSRTHCWHQYPIFRLFKNEWFGRTRRGRETFLSQPSASEDITIKQINTLREYPFCRKAQGLSLGIPKKVSLSAWSRVERNW